MDSTDRQTARGHLTPLNVFRISLAWLWMRRPSALLRARHS
jgi:hypothetical protein